MYWHIVKFLPFPPFLRDIKTNLSQRDFIKLFHIGLSCFYTLFTQNGLNFGTKILVLDKLSILLYTLLNDFNQNYC